MYATKTSLHRAMRACVRPTLRTSTVTEPDKLFVCGRVQYQHCLTTIPGIYGQKNWNYVKQTRRLLQTLKPVCVVHISIVILTVLIRPADIVVGRLMFYPDSTSSVCLLFYLSGTLRPRWMELSQNGHMLGSECDLKIHIRNLGYLLPNKWGPQNHLFWRLCNLKVHSTQN